MYRDTGRVAALSRKTFDAQNCPNAAFRPFDLAACTNLAYALRHDRRDSAAAMLAIDGEVGIHGEDTRSAVELGHPDEASVGKRHGQIGVLLDELFERLALSHHLEFDDQKPGADELEETAGTVGQARNQMKGFREHGFACQEGRRQSLELCDRPRVMIVAADEKGDERTRINDDFGLAHQDRSDTWGWSKDRVGRAGFHRGASRYRTRWACGAWP